MGAPLPLPQRIRSLKAQNSLVGLWHVDHQVAITFLSLCLRQAQFSLITEVQTICMGECAFKRLAIVPLSVTLMKPAIGQ